MNVAQALDAAADKIERDGWWQSGVWPRPSPESKCAMLAIRHVCPSKERWSIYELLLAAIGKRGATVGRIADWNDAPGRTKEEVIAMLRAVAATERARECRLLPVVIQEVCHVE